MCQTDFSNNQKNINCNIRTKRRVNLLRACDTYEEKTNHSKREKTHSQTKNHFSLKNKQHNGLCIIVYYGLNIGVCMDKNYTYAVWCK